MIVIMLNIKISAGLRAGFCGEVREWR